MPVSPSTFTQLRNLAETEIVTIDPTLSDFSEGSNLDAIVGAAAVLADDTNRVAIRLYRAHLLDTAEGEALDALALDRFGLARKAASPAVGSVLWAEDAASGYMIPAGTSVQGTGPDGALFEATTTADAVSNSGLAIPVQSIGTGRSHCCRPLHNTTKAPQRGRPRLHQSRDRLIP
jgi:uncharacterized phage protein gp47/JayE